MKFRVKFNESKVVHTVRADKKEDFVKYITENVSKISEIEKLDESVKVTPQLIDSAWKELQRRARKNHYISTQAMEAVCHKFAQFSEWDDEKGTDTIAFDRIWDLLIDRMDAENYELVDSDDYNKMFNLPTAPQTSLDIQMNQMRNRNNAMVRESKND